MKVKLKKINTGQQKMQLNMDLLRGPEMRERHAVEVENKFQELNVQQEEQRPEEDIECKWNMIKESMQKAAEKILPKRERKVKMPWMTDNILEIMIERKKSKNTERYNKLDDDIRTECRKAKEEWLKERCNEIEELGNTHKEKAMQNKVKELTIKNKNKKGGSCISNKCGKTLFAEEEIAERWMEYIKELYSDERRGQIPAIETLSGPRILESEVKSALKAMKSGKAAGSDEISSEMLRALGDNSIKRITELVNMIYNSGDLPKDLKKSIFVPIPKKAKAVNCADFRTISLMSHFTKLLLRIILERNKRRLEQEVGETQSGFRTGKGTREGIFNMRMICERYLEDAKRYFCVFY